MAKAIAYDPKELISTTALVQGGDASRESSTESTRATLLQGGDASRGSSTEFARATLLQRGDCLSAVGGDALSFSALRVSEGRISCP